MRVQRTLLALGAVGPVLFVAVYLVNGAVQCGYSSWHDTISVLSLGGHGWVQDLNFVFYGVLTLAFAEGLRRSGAANRSGVVLLAVAGLGLLVIGVFRTDPVLGYPDGQLAVVTAGGLVHNLGALVVFVAFPAAALVMAFRACRGWAVFSIATGVLSLVAVGFFFAAVAAANGQDGGDSPAGLYERLPTYLIGLWQVGFAVLAARGTRLGRLRQSLLVRQGA